MTSYQEMILGIIAAVFASSGFWMVIQNQLHVRATKKDDLIDLKSALANIQKHNSDIDEMTKHTKAMVMGLGCDKIKFLCTHYIERWETDGIPLTPEEHKELKKYLYEPYKKMGGDGTVDKLYKQFDEIPIGGSHDEH